MRRDFATAYAASAARVASWAVVLGVAYRSGGDELLAAFATVRVFITFCSYLALGIPPALLSVLAALSDAPDEAPATAPDTAPAPGPGPGASDPTPPVDAKRTATTASDPRAPLPAAAPDDTAAATLPPAPVAAPAPAQASVDAAIAVPAPAPASVNAPPFARVAAAAPLSAGLLPVAALLSYANPLDKPAPSVARPRDEAITAALQLAAGLAVVAVFVALVAVGHAKTFLPAQFTRETADLIAIFGCGVSFRIYGDVVGAGLQYRGRISVDNTIVMLGDVLFGVWTMVAWERVEWRQLAPTIAIGFLVAQLLSTLVRVSFLGSQPAGRSFFVPRLGLYRVLLVTGGVILFGQLADFLYAPANVLLIGRWLGPGEVAAYAPALQIDGALLLSVGAMAAVILPTSARLMAGRDAAALRRLYLRATAAGLGLLLAGAGGVVLLAPWAFWLWFGDAMSPTRAILPLVLIHTVVGGSGGIGRAILLTTGHTLAFAFSAVVGGVANIALALLALQMGFGLRGVVMATVLTVTLRCGFWMPWYVLRVALPRVQRGSATSTGRVKRPLK